MLDRLLAPLMARWPWFATAIRVQKRFSEVRGGYLAAAITLMLFLAIFPLLLVAIAIIGFITANHTDATSKIISNLGLTGQAAQTMTNALEHAASTKRAASIIGLLGLLWSGLGVVGALEYALDATWQQSGRTFKDKVRGLLWCAGALLIALASITITTFSEVATQGLVLSIASIVVAISINFVFWLWTFFVLSYRRVQWHSYIPGAIVGALGMEVIKQLATWLPQLFAGASALYGSIGVVFGLIAIFALFGRLTVYASVLNVICWEARNGTVEVEIEIPKVPGEVPIEANRSGASKD